MCLHITSDLYRIASHELACPIQGISVHKFQPTRYITTSENGSHRSTSIFSRPERHQHQQIMPWQREQLQNYFGHNSERSFTANHQLSEIVTRRILQHICTRPDDLTGWQDQLKIQHI